MPLSVDAPWAGHEPAAVHAFLGATTAWWICGGWAVDLWLGRTTRRHADTDIGCLRQNALEVIGALDGWTIYEADSGRLRGVEPARLAGDAKSLWCHESDASEWGLQVMLEESSGGRWTYRREPRISLAIDALVWSTESGLRVLKPEIQLLYKAAQPREKDQLDFDQLLPALTPAARTWLQESIELAHPKSEWLEQLSAAPL